jgi:tetratricopeptide (TPR) repeat protein
MLIGAETLALVGDAVEVGEERLLELKGKSEPVAAYTLLSVREVAERSHASRFVGRERELRQLVEAWERALAWRQVQARVLAHRGEHSEAERLAREAVARLEQTDSLAWQGDGWWDLAEVLEAGGRREDAITAWQEALDRYERKGIVPLARRVRERLATLQETAS